jgi:hypothetical protein
MQSIIVTCHDLRNVVVSLKHTHTHPTLCRLSILAPLTRELEAREQAATRAAEAEIEAIEQRRAQRKRAVGAAAAI